MPTPNLIKYTTTSVTGALKSGNVAIAVDDTKDYGPTSSTGFYNGYNIPNGGYVIYNTPASGTPKILAAVDDNQLISFSKSISGTNITTVADALVWFKGSPTYHVVNTPYPNIVTDNLTVLYDSRYVMSYPRTGTSWYDLRSGNNATLSNGPSYDSSGFLSFDGTNDLTATSSAINFAGNFSIGMWVKVSRWADPSSPCGGAMASLMECANGYWNMWGLETNSGGPYFFTYYNTSYGGVSMGFGASAFLNRWMYLTVSYTDLGPCVIYLNGAQVTSQTVPGSISPNGTVGINYQSQHCGNSYSQNQTARVEIYNKALSALEVRQNFYGGEFVTNGLMCYFDASNLVSYGRTSANWYDLSGNNRQGYVRGTPTFGTAFGGYIETGANQTANYVELPESALQNLTNGFVFSLDWWCTMKDTSAGRYQQSMVNSSGGNLFIIGKDATSFSIYATTLVSGTAPTYTVDVPVHLAVTSDGTYQYFYKNGVLTSTWSAAWGDLKTVGGWIIDQEQDAAKGAFDANQNTYGWWHTTRLYNRVLTAAEVFQNYNSQKNRFGL